MSASRDDDDTVPGLSLGKVETERKRRSSAPRIVETRRRSTRYDLAELALEEIKALGVVIPAHMHMGVHGVLREMGQRFYTHGEHVGEQKAGHAATQLAEERARTLGYERDLRALRMRVLEAGRDEISIRDLVNHVLGGPKETGAQDGSRSSGPSASDDGSGG